MIASRGTVGTGQDSMGESTSDRSAVRANIPLQPMAIRITTEIDHDADLEGQQVTDSKSDAHHGSQGRADMSKSPSNMAFDNSIV